jgi:LysM repeat protein
MNGYYTEDESLESLGEILEDIESDESDEFDEARRPLRRPMPRPRVPNGRGLFRARLPGGQTPGANYVTQTQLQAALARVGAQIKTNADATTAVANRANALSSRLDQETAARKKETTALRKDLKGSRDMSILPLLLTKPPELTLTRQNANDNNSPITNVAVKSADNTLPLLLIMMMGGMGGEGKGDDNNMMLMLALVMMNKN